MSRKLQSAAFIALALFVSVPAFCQLETGTFTGRVNDPSGAVVPNATVGVVNTETNFTSETKTNAEGLYRIPSMQAGKYRITVAAAGFKQSVHDGLELHVAEVQEVNVVVELGVATETVRVTGEVAQLQTETSASGQTLEGAYLQQLPLYQRYVQDVYYLTPNVDMQGVAYAGNLNGFHIDGLSDTKVGFFQDGVYAAASDNGTIYTAQAIQSTIEEVKVLSTVLPAEYGHSGGGALAAVQRTGTNTLHGEVSEFGRVSAMQERKYFDQYRFGQFQPGLTNAPSELFQQPNATLSGPVYIPKIHDGRNKTFFLFAVERIIEKQGKQAVYQVPDANEIAGNFSFAGNGGPAANQLYDPQSTALVNGKYQRTPIAGNIIAPSRIDPVAVKFFSLTPYAPPNTAGTYSNTGAANNFNGTYLKKYFSENYTGRLDQQFTPTFKMYGNWLYKSIYQRQPNPQISNPLFDASLVQSHDYDNTATLGATKIITPTLVNEMKIGYNRFIDEVSSPDQNADTAKLLGIPNVSGAELPGGLPLGVNGPSKNVIENFTFKDDFSWVKNKHSFKFGYDLLHMRQDQWTVGSPSGTFNFDGGAGLAGNCPANNLSGASTCPNTGGIVLGPGGYNLPAFELGSVTSFSTTIPTASWLPRENISSVFFQDDWKVSPTLTLNLGVRWVMEGPWHTKYGQYAVFSPTAADNVVAGDLGATVHPGGNMTNRQWQRPEPRVGLAWHPLNKVVIRTGFAMMHVDRGLAPSQLSEYSISASVNEPTGNPTPLFQLHNGPAPLTFPTLQGNGYVPYVGCTTGTLNGVTFPTCGSRTATYIDPNLKDPYSMTWSFAIQYQLFKNTLVELSYDGSASAGNIETPNENVLPNNYDAGNSTLLAAVAGNGQVYRPYVNFQNISYMTNISHSSYNSGTVHVQKRLANSLSYDSFFTFSKSLDDSGITFIDLNPLLYKGPSAFDRRYHYAGNFSYNLPFGKGKKFLNMDGPLNAIFGGYNLVWQYDTYSGNPVTPGVTGSPNSGPPTVIAGITGRPNLVGNPSMANNWQNLGNDRFNQAGVGVNSSVCCLSAFAYPAAYTFGNEGKGILYLQRTIGASFSLRKEFKVKERARLQIRLDFQNPFKWYTLGNPGTTVDLKNVVAGAALNSPAAELPGNAFGKLTSGGEGTTVADGGVPMMNGTIKFTF